MDGCSDAEGNFTWDGSTVNPTGETISRSFKLICKSPHSDGITADQLELAYGLGSALSELTSPHWFVAKAEGNDGSASDESTDSLLDAHPASNNSQSTPPRSCIPTCIPKSPDGSSSSNGSISAQRAAVVLARTMADSIALTKGRQNAAAICRFEPSPTGIKQDAVSDAELHTAVVDSDL